MTFETRRIYDPPGPHDGIRVLVDRLWPRGVAKVKARLDCWMKDVAPTPALRTWFGHKPERFSEFSKRYREELAANPAVAELRKMGRSRKVTLLYGASDPDFNHAVVLAAALKGRRDR
jgi:uncharacterized protein YeaO (DUF488 family)